MRTALLLLAVSTTVGLAAEAQTVRHVPSQYATIQKAIDAARTRDTVLVAPGAYPERIDFRGKAITVKSSSGAGATVIDGQKSGTVVTISGGVGTDTVLTGFTITGGKTTINGGGILCTASSPFIHDNIIHDNTASSGGGIYADRNSQPVIFANVITKNFSQYDGGGICSGQAIIVGNDISSNGTTSFPSNGGGIQGGRIVWMNRITGNVTDQEGAGVAGAYLVQDNLISGNWFAVDGGGVGNCTYVIGNVIKSNMATKGGGVIGGTLVKNNTIEGNTADSGGGVFSASEVIDNVITGNTGGGIRDLGRQAAGNVILRNTQGAGIHVEGSTVTIANNIIAGNQGDQSGGGMVLYNCRGVVLNNTMAGNSASGSGGGMAVDGYSVPVVANNIFWNNTAPRGKELVLQARSPTTLTLSFCNIQGARPSVHVDPGATLVWGSGMMDADPKFVDQAGHDLHLLRTSPCFNKADGSVSGLPATDFEGNPRSALGGTDIGADEFSPHLYFTGTASPGWTIEVKLIGVPKTAAIWGFSLTPTFLDPPLTIPGLGKLYLEPPILPFPLGNFSATGLLKLAIALPPTLPVPTTFPMQALIGCQLSNPVAVPVR